MLMLISCCDQNKTKPKNRWETCYNLSKLCGSWLDFLIYMKGPTYEGFKEPTCFLEKYFNIYCICL